MYLRESQTNTLERYNKRIIYEFNWMVIFLWHLLDLTRKTDASIVSLEKFQWTHLCHTGKTPITWIFWCSLYFMLVFFIPVNKEKGVINLKFKKFECWAFAAIGIETSRREKEIEYLSLRCAKIHVYFQPWT